MDQSYRQYTKPFWRNTQGGRAFIEGLLGVFLCGIFIPSLSLAAQPPVLTGLFVDPPLLTVGPGNQEVTVSVRVTDADGDLKVKSVKLHELREGLSPLRLGRMMDDGTNGDVIPDDGRFTIRIRLSSSEAQMIHLRVKAKDWQKNKAVPLQFVLPVVPPLESVSLSATGSFPFGDSFPLGARSLITADFNKDGFPDLASILPGSQTVSVLLGQEDGRFLPPLGVVLNVPVGFIPISLASGDFNQDGIPDLAVANNSDVGTVSVFLGDGSGRFLSAFTHLEAGVHPRTMVAGDFNRDGAVDLAILNAGSFLPPSGPLGSVTIFLGDGTGSLSKATDFSVGSASCHPQAMVTGDFTGDGVLDLAMADNSSCQTVSILIGDGTGRFGPAIPTAVDDFAGSPSTGDFNGDGTLDLVVTNANRGTTWVLLGDGRGRFELVTRLSDGAFATPGDFNGDGILDLAVGHRPPNFGFPVEEQFPPRCLNLPPRIFPSQTVALFLGDGTGGFAASADRVVVNGAVSATAVDLNDDGALDLAVLNRAGSVSVLLGDGVGGFAGLTPVAVGDHPTSATTADFNGDALLDLAVTNQFDNTVSLLLGNGAGDFAPAADMAVGDCPHALASGDFNRDGVPDLAVVNGDSDTVSILLGDGVGGVGSTVQFVVGDFPKAIVTGDFNGDGSLDLAVTNGASGPNTVTDRVSVLLGDGRGAFGSPLDVVVGPNPTSLTAADFNRDGLLDLAVVLDVALGRLSLLSILLGDGAGRFEPAATAVEDNPFGPNDRPESVTTADVNQDGMIDLVVAGRQVLPHLGTPRSAAPTVGTIHLLLGDGAGRFRPRPTLTVGRALSAVITDDFNGDGAVDLAVANVADNTVAVLPGDGAGNFGLPAGFVVGSSPRALTAGDFNGDGLPDLAVPDRLGNTIAILLNTTSVSE